MRLSEVLVKFILVFLLYLFCIYFITTAAIICREYKDSHKQTEGHRHCVKKPSFPAGALCMKQL